WDEKSPTVIFLGKLTPRWDFLGPANWLTCSSSYESTLRAAANISRNADSYLRRCRRLNSGSKTTYKNSIAFSKHSGRNGELRWLAAPSHFRFSAEECETLTAQTRGRWLHLQRVGFEIQVFLMALGSDNRSDRYVMTRADLSWMCALGDRFLLRAFLPLQA